MKHIMRMMVRQLKFRQLSKQYRLESHTIAILNGQILKMIGS